MTCETAQMLARSEHASTDASFGSCGLRWALIVVKLGCATELKAESRANEGEG